MRVAIATRIFDPEPSAASFRLAALANALHEAGHEVEVLTVSPPAGLATADKQRPYRVKRFPVLRDRTGYVRGYLQYLSFDVPLFFRLLFGRRREMIVVEPPPTTGFFTRISTSLRCTPYAYFAADIWSDATAQTNAPNWMVCAVRGIERFALRGARVVLSVNEGVTARLAELGISGDITTVGNGVDTEVFNAAAAAGTVIPDGARPYALYSGTASEWQGAGIFIDAFSSVLDLHPDARLVFLGQGSDWPALKRQAAYLPAGAVEFVPTVPPEQAAIWMARAQTSIASIRPDSGYDFAFPTKVFASLACGSPVIYAGVGAVPEFLRAHSSEARLGESVEYESGAVAEALIRAFDVGPSDKERNELAEWAATHVSLDAVARRGVRALEGDAG